MLQMNYKKHLKELRNKLADQQLSLLAGAGLSRSVSTKFLSWEELLIDLAYDLSKLKIDAAYQQHVDMKVDPQIDVAEFKRMRCRESIREIGYLEIVSAYIKSKGHSESIATYIEEHIPHVYEEDGQYYMELNGEKEELSKDRLSIHRSLVDLPWNNIYTTNYDDLLDICIDNDRYGKLKQEIKILEQDIKAAEQIVAEFDAALEALSQPDASSRIKLQSGPSEEMPEDQDTQETNIEERIKKEKFSLNYQRGSAASQLDRLESLQRTKESELNKCYQVVKSATGLRIKKQKNIIKLHGSLRTADERNNFIYGFDGDHKNQYVIAKEDYENYPVQHEAFTQLMRISLLQESFCLLGFSGVDLNFREWINWVRDILNKAAKNQDVDKQYKIYLVEASNDPVSKDLQLFYENHNIIRIPLLAPEVITVFHDDFKEKVPIESRWDALGAFLRYLNNDENVKADIPSADVTVQKEFQQAWQSVSTIDLQSIPEEEALAPVVNRLDKITGDFWFPNLKYPALLNPRSLVDNFHIANWSEHLNERPILKRYLAHALRALFIPIKNQIEPEVIEVLLSDPGTYAGVKELLERNDALEGKSETVAPATHNQILSIAYSLNFEDLHKLLESWDAKGRDTIVKAGFLAHFNPKASVDTLNEAIWSYQLGRGEQMLYGLELLYFLTQPRIFTNDQRISRLITAFTHSDYKLVKDAFKDLYKQVEKKRENQKPYGSDRFTKSRSMQLSKYSDSEFAVQMLMLLSETGFQLAVGSVYMVSHEDWYPVLKAGFRFYPSAFLFYSLQYGNKDFLKKAGQDYAFSNNERIQAEVPLICQALFKALVKGAPPNIKEHIPDFLSGLLVSVKPEVWQSHFMNWWKTLVAENIAFRNDHRDRNHALVNTAISFISDAEILVELIGDCLRASIDGQEDKAINFLYYLNRNIHYKRLKLTNNQKIELSSLINGLITEMAGSSIDLMFVLGNLYHLLTDDQKDKIKNVLDLINLSSVKGSRVWRIIAYFSEGAPLLQGKIKKAVIENTLLWYTGINGNKISGGGKSEYIPIMSMSNQTVGKLGLTWDHDELTKIYNAMVFALRDINRIDLYDRWFNFTDVLEEMLRFLDAYEFHLGEFENYKEIKLLAQDNLERNRNYKDIDDGLTSSEKSEVLTALAELSTRIYQGRIEHALVNLIMNKILLQSEPALEAAINYVSVWVASKEEPDRFREHEPILLRILKKYNTYPLEDSDDAFIEEYLVKIARHMQLWGPEDPIINIWLGNARESKFNNVLQFIIQIDDPNPADDED
jgi:hypothetical protein